MTQSEDIFDAQWDGIEECRCRVRFGNDVIAKAVMTAEKKVPEYTEQGVKEGITFSVKFRLADMPQDVLEKVGQNLNGKLCEVERGGVFGRLRITGNAERGGILILDMGGEN